MLDFNRGSYIIRAIQGSDAYAKRSINVSERGDVVLDNGEIFVPGRNVTAINVIQDYTYLDSEAETINKVIPFVIAFLFALAASFYIMWQWSIDLTDVAMHFLMMLLLLPTVGLFAYFITVNIMKTHQGANTSYEATLQWDDNEYLLLLTRKDLKKIQNR